MQIILAKTAGFCFGVNRAVKLTYELLEQGRPVATLGPLIHNPQVVEDLESKGAITCDSVDDVPDGCEVVIRSHGVGQSVYDKISTRRLAYHDATCPFVTKIHKIAARAGAEGAMLLVAGDAKHPEVQGIVGHTTGKVEVFANLAELEKLEAEAPQATQPAQPEAVKEEQPEQAQPKADAPEDVAELNNWLHQIQEENEQKRLQEVARRQANVEAENGYD